MSNKLIRLSIYWIPLVILFSSCKVTWVPEYNAALEENISASAKKTDKLYLDLLDVAKTERTYDKYKDRYNDIESDINSIKLKNEARRNNQDFLVMNKNLLDAFQEAKNYHKTHDVLSDGEIKSYQATLRGYWKPLYLAERGLK